MQPVPTSRIRVGDRIRKDLGDIAELADSIKLCQLQPIVVTPDMQLVAGERRLRACELAGIPVHVRIAATIKDALAALRAEADENLLRKAWTREEEVAYALRLRELMAPAAAERQAEGRARGGRVRQGVEEDDAASGQACPQAGGEAGRVGADVAKALGMGRRTLEKATAVVKAAELNPELRPLVDKMNTSGKVDAVYRELQRAEAAGGRIHDKDSYSTQRWILDGIHAVEVDGIALDPCSNELARRLGFVRALVSWTIEDDSRRQSTWCVVKVDGRYVVFFQPPYSCPDDGDKPGTLGPDDPGCPGLTTKLCEEWDAGKFDAVYALVKDDASTEWWAQLRDRAAFMVKPRERLAHVVGIDGEGREIEHAGSDFNSAMLVLSKGTRAELLDLGRRLAKAYEGRADVYTAAWVLEMDDEPAPPAKGKRGARPRR